MENGHYVVFRSLANVVLRLLAISELAVQSKYMRSTIGATQREQRHGSA